MVELNAASHVSAAREIIACEGPDIAHAIVLDERRGTPALKRAIERELGRLPPSEPSRTETFRRWRAEARR